MESPSSNLTTAQVQQLIESALTDAVVRVADMTGTSDHFEIEVTSPDFAGLSRIEQHKLVHKALGQHLTTSIHAVQIQTKTP